MNYQTSHFSVGFIGLPTGHLYAWANSFEFANVPITLIIKLNELVEISLN